MGGGEEGGWEAGEGGRGRAGGGRGRGDGEEEGGDRGRGRGLSFFCLGEGRGEGSGGGGERDLFLKLREVWEESFSVPSPFFLLRGCLWGGGGLEGVWVKSWMVV